MRHAVHVAWAIVSILGFSAGPASAARAASACAFFQRGDVLYLRGDCETDSTLQIPEGVTLDGLHHRIKARDPDGGSFTGAVVQAEGSVAHVRNLVIDAAGLSAVCHEIEPVDQRLRAILFDGASGSILDNHIVGVNQGESGCQEGAGIEVRAADAAQAFIEIRGNRVEHFQKTGIFVEGPISAGIYLNVVQGEGPLAYLVQNGIHLTGEVRGSVKLNRVSGMQFTGSSASATGLLIVDSKGPLDIALNAVQETGVGIRLTSVSRAEVAGNRVRESTYTGIAVDGRARTAAGNRIVSNVVLDSQGVGIQLFGEGARRNLVAGNVVLASGQAAVEEALDAAANAIFKNRTSAALHPPLFISND